MRALWLCQGLWISQTQALQPLIWSSGFMVRFVGPASSSAPTPVLPCRISPTSRHRRPQTLTERPALQPLHTHEPVAGLRCTRECHPRSLIAFSICWQPRACTTLRLGEDEKRGTSTAMDLAHQSQGIPRPRLEWRDFERKHRIVLGKEDFSPQTLKRCARHCGASLQ